MLKTVSKIKYCGHFCRQFHLDFKLANRETESLNFNFSILRRFIGYTSSRYTFEANSTKWVHSHISNRALHNTARMSDPCVQNVCNDIVKSGGDKREYRALTLDNDMLVLLISDPTTDKSSAAMDVHIGHLSDPTELPGLAHFCEHMLFLGTEKYPEENAYSKFLSSNGGSSNAFTTPEHTNFYFDVAPDQLPGALDRFSQFFLAPLFTESATGREVNAVNSENDKNIQNDAWRIHQLEKSTANPSHPYSKFGTGNKTTLETHPKELGLDVRDELLKFHSNFYSSNIMSLAILGKESLDELQSMVVPLVRDVKNKNVVMPEWLEHPYGPDQLKLQAHIVPIKDVRSLHVIWPMPDLHKYYKSNPGHYLGHLIGHEGPGSLLSELRNRGWVTQLVGGEKTGAKGFQFFNINVDLSEEGIEHVDDIITLMFQYIHMLRDEGPQQWVFKECQDLYNMQFLFKDKEKPSGYTSHCAAMLRDYPLKEILSGPYLLEDYDPSKIDMVLEKLVPETIRIAVIGQKFKGQTDLTEKWYGTEYSITNITEEKLQHWRSCGTHPNLKLPLPNDFIPTNFDLLQRDDDPAPLPQVIKDNELTRLWYCQDNVFLMPKACINVEMLSPYAYMDPLCTNMTHMFVALLQDTLNEYAYAAELAGISYNFHGTIYGLTLTVSGYHDKQHILLQKVLDKIVSFQIDPQRYAILLESYIRQLKNFKAEQPHRHAMYYTSMLTSEQMWTKDELLEATQELSIEKIHAFIPQLLSKLYLELLVYGNVTKERAHQITDILESTLRTEAHTKPLPASQRRRFREIQLPDNSSYVHHSHNDVHPSGSVEVYYQCTQQNTHNNMILELFCQLINESAFNELRTKQQLGYIVFSGARRSSGVQGLRFIVQSDREPAYVDSRIEAFLVSFYKELQDMDDEAFKKHLEALATKRLEKAKKLSSQNSRYWSEIITHLYNFDRANIEVDHLKTLSKKDILEFYEELLSHDSVKRRKMASYVTGTGTTSDKTEGKTEGAGQDNGKDEPLTEPPAVKQAEEIVDMNAFKEGMALYPLAKPFITITPTISKL